jgi:hypothetical protein
MFLIYENQLLLADHNVHTATPSGLKKRAGLNRMMISLWKTTCGALWTAKGFMLIQDTIFTTPRCRKDLDPLQYSSAVLD